jgi:hypothetical protein
MNILDSILDVFSSVGTWISEAITNLMPMFYSAESGLTIVGVLAVAGLAFSIVFLLLNVITGFLRFA